MGGANIQLYVLNSTCPTKKGKGSSETPPLMRGQTASQGCFAYPENPEHVAPQRAKVRQQFWHQGRTTSF